MLTLDAVNSCHMVAGNGLLYLEVWSTEEGLSQCTEKWNQRNIYPHMGYEVVVYEKETGNCKFLGMKICRKEEIMKCNHVKR